MDTVAVAYIAESQNKTLMQMSAMCERFARAAVVYSIEMHERRGEHVEALALALSLDQIAVKT